MANLKTTDKKSKSQSMGMHTEVLKGRTQQRFFDSEEAENLQDRDRCFVRPLIVGISNRYLYGHAHR